MHSISLLGSILVHGDRPSKRQWKRSLAEGLESERDEGREGGGARAHARARERERTGTYLKGESETVLSAFVTEICTAALYSAVSVSFLHQIINGPRSGHAEFSSNFLSLFKAIGSLIGDRLD